MSVISNTTPFIALSSVRLLTVLPDIFGIVEVAASVIEECQEGGRIVVPDLSKLPWIRVMPVQNQTQLPALFELDRGERDTLLLASMQTNPLVLMDEKLGRNIAEYLGFRVTGTLGILAKARSMGLIPSFLNAAQSMQTQGIYYSNALIQRMAVRLGEAN